MEAGKKTKKQAPASSKQKLLREIPQVDEVLQWLAGEQVAPIYLVKQSVSEELDILRQNILSGKQIAKSELSKKKQRYRCCNSYQPWTLNPARQRQECPG